MNAPTSAPPLPVKVYVPGVNVVPSVINPGELVAAGRKDSVYWPFIGE